MPARRYSSPPVWALHKLDPTSSSTHTKTAIHRMSQIDDELDKAVHELARWWIDNLDDDLYHARVQKIVELCHARPPGHRERDRFTAKFRAAGAKQEHVDAVIQDFEPQWTQAILSHVAKSVTSSHGVASVIRIILAETESLHGPLINQSSRDDLMKVVNSFDPPPPMIPAISRPQRPHLEIDDNIPEKTAEDMLVTPASATELQMPELKNDSMTSDADKTPSKGFSNEKSIHPSDQSSPLKPSWKRFQRRFHDLYIPDNSNRRSSQITSDDVPKARDSTPHNPKLVQFSLNSRLAPSAPIQSHHPNVFEAATPIPRGPKRKPRVHSSLSPRKRPSLSSVRHEAKLRLPSHLLKSTATHTRKEIHSACERQHLHITYAQFLSANAWKLGFDTDDRARASIGKILRFGAESVVVQALNTEQAAFQVFVACVPQSSFDAVRAIARAVAPVRFSFQIEARLHDGFVKWIVCLETPVERETVGVEFAKQMATLYALPSDTERCFVCGGRHGCVRCGYVDSFWEGSHPDCKQYLEFVPKLENTAS